MSAVGENLNEIRTEITNAARKAGRAPESVRLLAVSKTFPAEDVKSAYDAGQRMFGENRVQELEVKAPVLPQDIEWHLIGHLQSNKAAKAVEHASWIHSVDSVKLLSLIEKAAEKRNKTMNILLEVNISGEESKFGLRDDTEILEIAKAAQEMPYIRLRGLMTMAEIDADEKRLHETFAGLRAMRDRLEKELHITLPELSMGMSSDFPEAIAEGATIVRIGTANFFISRLPAEHGQSFCGGKMRQSPP